MMFGLILAAASTFCNPMSIPNMPVGIECWKFNDGDVLDGTKMAPWAIAMWQGDRGDGVKIAHQFRELADPEIHVWDGTWYLYPSCGLMWKSRDCGGTWEHVVLEEHNPNYAPSVTRFRGKYYLAESHVRRGLLVSDSPTGPFSSLGRFKVETFASEADPEINFGDPALFADGDHLYIYLGCVARQKCLWGAELDPENPLQALRPAKRMVELDPRARPWMRGPLEGAYVFKRGDTYYFTHAGGHPKLGSYSTCVWKGRTPLGPFAPQTNNPVFTRPDGCARGGGHGGIFQDASGDWWVTYTIWPKGAKFHAFERFIGMDRISFDGNGDIVPRTPTDEPQWLPSTGKRGPTGWKSLKVMTTAKKAVDGMLRTYETFTSVPGSMEFDFGCVAELRAFRIIWCDLGLDVHRGVKGGAYRYRLERRIDGKWSVWYDASRNETDLTVDYREAPEACAEAVRLTVLEAPRGITPAVTEFAVFGGKRK